jgi:hypothetical protein
MDDAEKLSSQIEAITALRKNLSESNPNDTDSFTELTALIGDLNQQLDQVMTSPNIPDVDPATVDVLKVAQAKLQQAVDASQGADSILKAATELAKV